MWIQNVSMAAIMQGLHYFDPGKTVLIQIQDKGTHTWATPLYKDKFMATYRFEFDDTEEQNGNEMSDNDALALACILRRCMEDRMNIVVHCHAGLCRSGAVAECGHMIGFQDVEEIRIPNVLVKNKIRRALGITQSLE